MSARLPFTDVDAACDASRYPSIYADAYVCVHEILRREKDAARVERDCALLPATALGASLRREWMLGVERRRHEIEHYRRMLARLRASPGAMATVEQAVAAATANAGRWLWVQGGSERDG